MTPTSRNWFDVGQAVVGGGRHDDVPIAGTFQQGTHGQVAKAMTNGVPGAQEKFRVMVSGVIKVRARHEDPPGVPPGVTQ
jgi:hypothetical protein